MGRHRHPQAPLRKLQLVKGFCFNSVVVCLEGSSTEAEGICWKKGVLLWDQSEVAGCFGMPSWSFSLCAFSRYRFYSRLLQHLWVDTPVSQIAWYTDCLRLPWKPSWISVKLSSSQSSPCCKNFHRLSQRISRIWADMSLFRATEELAKMVAESDLNWASWIIIVPIFFSSLELSSPISSPPNHLPSVWLLENSDWIPDRRQNTHGQHQQYNVVKFISWFQAWFPSWLRVASVYLASKVDFPSTPPKSADNLLLFSITRLKVRQSTPHQPLRYFILQILSVYHAYECSESRATDCDRVTGRQGNRFGPEYHAELLEPSSPPISAVFPSQPFASSCASFRKLPKRYKRTAVPPSSYTQSWTPKTLVPCTSDINSIFLQALSAHSESLLTFTMVNSCSILTALLVGTAVLAVPIVPEGIASTGMSGGGTYLYRYFTMTSSDFLRFWH